MDLYWLWYAIPVGIILIAESYALLVRKRGTLTFYIRRLPLYLLAVVIAGLETLALHFAGVI